jgi:hypothetical protein
MSLPAPTAAAMRLASLLVFLALCAPLCAQESLAKKLSEFETRYRALAADDAEGRRALARWCAAQKLRARSQRMWREVVKLAPDDKAAREALGHVGDGGKWYESTDAVQLALGKTRRLSEWAALDDSQKSGLTQRHEYWLTQDELARLDNGEALLAHTRKGECEVLTREYRIVSALAQPKTLELGCLIEQAVRQWRGAAGKAYDSGKPASLRIVILKDNAAFVQMIRDDVESYDQGLVKAQGFYDGAACWMSYFDNWFQTIHVLLHEARHQFDSEVSGAVNVPGWYWEGIAEYFGTHSWDGKTLKMGELAPSRNYSLFFCNKLIGQRKHKGAREMIENPWPSGVDPAFYQNAWGFLYFLKNSSYSEGYAKWEQDLLAGKLESPAAQLEAFKKHVAEDLDKFDKDYRAQIKEWARQCPKEWK